MNRKIPPLAAILFLTLTGFVSAVRAQTYSYSTLVNPNLPNGSAGLSASGLSGDTIVFNLGVVDESNVPGNVGYILSGGVWSEFTITGASENRTSINGIASDGTLVGAYATGNPVTLQSRYLRMDRTHCSRWVGRSDPERHRWHDHRWHLPGSH